jgi:hypothetical protein
MKKSVHTLIQESIIENNIDTKSHNKIEAISLIDIVCDKIEWSEYNQSQAQRKVNVIQKSVSMLFVNLKKDLVISE